MATGQALVGRVEESAALAALLTDLVAGIGGAAWIEGEPGIGKSELVRHFVATAEAAGCTTAVGGAEELGWGAPLEAIRRALAPFEVVLAPAGGRPNLAAAGDPTLRTAESLVEQLEAACARGPVVACFEDLQWADDASIALWRRLLGATSQQPLLLIATCRLLPRPDALATLRRHVLDAGAAMISLGPLSDPDLSQLVATLVGGAPGPQLLALATHAGGNPLLVGEVLDAIRREDRLRALGPGWVDLVPGRSPIGGLPTLNRATKERLRFLSPEVHEVMQAAAVAGTGLDIDAVAALVRRSPESLAPIVAEAVAGGVLVDAAGSLRFRHEFLMQALLEQIPSAVRCALHYQLAQHLDATGAPLTLVARHVVAAEEAVDYWLVGWLTGAGEPLSYLTPQVAVELLNRVFAVLTPSTVDAEKLRAQLVRALYLLARYEDLDQVAREVVVGTKDCARVAEMTWYRTYSLLRLGRVEPALVVLDETLSGDQPDEGFVARMIALRATALSNLGRRDEALESAARALSLGERHGDRLAMGTALNARAYVHIDRIETGAAIADLQRGLDVVADDPECADLRLLLLMNFLNSADDEPLADADANAARLLDEGERAASPLRLSAVRITVASYWYGRGRFDDALAVMEPLDFDGLRRSPGFLVRAHGVLAALAAHRGESGQAGNHLHRLAEFAPGEGEVAVNLMYSVYAQAMLAEQSGDLAAALTILTHRMATDVDRRFAQAVVWLPDVVRLAMALGDPKLARRSTEICQEVVGGLRRARLDCPALRCRALLDGDPDLALEAVSQISGTPWRYESARTHEDAAALLATAGRAEIARDHLSIATEHYAEMGAAWDARRAAARLRSLGIRQGVRGPRRRAATGWAALTQTERRVAMQVGAGRTNPEIATSLLVSRRTVQTHVSHILTKLGVRSRLDIARESIGRDS